MEKIKPKLLGCLIENYFFLDIVAVILIIAGGAVYLSTINILDTVGIALIVLGIAILIVTIILSKLKAHTTSIYFSDEKIVYETGIVSTRKKKVPINMVTDSSITRGLRARLFGFATLNISTSGSTGYEIICNGLDYNEINSVHEELYKKIGAINKDKK
ncbi:MAG: PH domain-containing protein [Candidatus Micrarchaeota archaeon]